MRKKKLPQMPVPPALKWRWAISLPPALRRRAWSVPSNPVPTPATSTGSSTMSWARGWRTLMRGGVMERRYRCRGDPVNLPRYDGRARASSSVDRALPSGGRSRGFESLLARLQLAIISDTHMPRGRPRAAGGVHRAAARRRRDPARRRPDRARGARAARVARPAGARGARQRRRARAAAAAARGAGGRGRAARGSS